MGVAIEKIDLNVLNMQTRFPFKYGIASLEALPHLFVRVTARIGGHREVGLAADGLPPKWFTKYPDVPFASDLGEMLAVILKACDFAQEVVGETVFEFWHRIYQAQKKWVKSTAYPPLLWAFGASLVERAVIDAFCRAKGLTFAEAVRKNALGIRLEQIHPELEGMHPAALLPEVPVRSVVVRHTVGLADPLEDGDVADPVNDGLPQSLAANVLAYGLTHLKIKLCGDAKRDLDRLQRIGHVMRGGCAFTLDGNEQYVEVAPFRALWEAIQRDAHLTAFMQGVLFVEQPLRRDVALTEDVKAALAAWPDCPPMIIDESDGALDSSVRALDCGYAGTSHKNCKGVFKGIANACLMAHRRRVDPESTYVLSSEDLANVGPVALLQDLAVLSVLGISHSERNGHHYFAGLQMFPDGVQAQVLAHHGSLYRRHAHGFPALDVKDGRVDVSSVLDAPFGYGFDFDTTQFTPLSDWSADSLGI